MNKRQRKKKYKKKYGFNPLSKKQVATCSDAIEGVVNHVIDCLNRTVTRIKETVKKLETMSDDEFEEIVSQLPLKQQILARAIRDGG